MDSNAEAKCIAVNPARTEQIAIGANDPYARVYDRRMLVKTSSVDRNQTLFPTGKQMNFLESKWSLVIGFLRS